MGPVGLGVGPETEGGEPNEPSIAILEISTGPTLPPPFLPSLHPPFLPPPPSKKPVPTRTRFLPPLS